MSQVLSGDGQGSGKMRLTTITLGLPSIQVRFLRIEAERLGTHPSDIAQALIRREMTAHERTRGGEDMTDADCEEPNRRQSGRGPPSRF